MTLGIRHFLIDDDEVRPLTHALRDRLRRGEARFPQYAGRDLHVVDVTVEIVNRRPVRVRSLEAATLSLDRDGGQTSRLLDDLRASLATARGRAPARRRWSPSKAQIDRITDMALGRRKSKLRSPRTVESSLRRTNRLR